MRTKEFNLGLRQSCCIHTKCLLHQNLRRVFFRRPYLPFHRWCCADRHFHPSYTLTGICHRCPKPWPIAWVSHNFLLLGRPRQDHSSGEQLGVKLNVCKMRYTLTSNFTQLSGIRLILQRWNLLRYFIFKMPYNPLYSSSSWQLSIKILVLYLGRQIFFKRSKYEIAEANCRNP